MLYHTWHWWLVYYDIMFNNKPYLEKCEHDIYNQMVTMGLMDRYTCRYLEDATIEQVKSLVNYKIKFKKFKSYLIRGVCLKCPLCKSTVYFWTRRYSFLARFCLIVQPHWKLIQSINDNSSLIKDNQKLNICIDAILPVSLPRDNTQ